MNNSRTAAVSLLLALSLAVGGCSLLNQSYRCEPAPGPDRPDAEEPDRIGGMASTDSTSHLPCE